MNKKKILAIYFHKKNLIYFQQENIQERVFPVQYAYKMYKEEIYQQLCFVFIHFIINVLKHGLIKTHYVQYAN